MRQVGSVIQIEITRISQGRRCALLYPGKKQKNNIGASLRDFCFPSHSLICTGLGLCISLTLAGQMAEAFAASILQWDRADFVPCLLWSLSTFGREQNQVR